MKLLIGAAVMSFSLSACGVGSADDLIGAWTAADSPTASSIVLDKYRKFSAKEFPADLACPGKVAGRIDGSGTWEYQSRGDRVFLVFSTIRDPKCETPFGVVIFVRAKDELAAIPDVDKPSGSIIYRRQVAKGN
jgi:hypothetical protein